MPELSGSRKFRATGLPFASSVSSRIPLVFSPFVQPAQAGRSLRL